MFFQNSSTTGPNDGFRNNDKFDEISPGSNDDHISDDIEDTKDEDINYEDNNLDKKKIQQLGRIRK